MKIAVCVKQVPDTEASIVPDGAAIDESAVNDWILNPYDEFAVEEAVRLKEEVDGAELVAVSVGPERVKGVFQPVLAMGADRGIHVVAKDLEDPAQIAAALAAALEADGPPQVVFTGTVAIDDSACQVHLRLARHLDASAAINVSAFSWAGEGAEVTREAGGGAEERLFLPVPCLVAVTRGINKPRYPTLPNIMKARKKEVRGVSPSDLKTAGLSAGVELLCLETPEEFAGGRILEGAVDETASELVELLRKEAGVV